MCLGGCGVVNESDEKAQNRTVRCSRRGSSCGGGGRKRDGDRRNKQGGAEEPQGQARNGSLMRYYSEELTSERNCTALQCTVIERATTLEGEHFSGEGQYL